MNFGISLVVGYSHIKTNINNKTNDLKIFSCISLGLPHPLLPSTGTHVSSSLGLFGVQCICTWQPLCNVPWVRSIWRMSLPIVCSPPLGSDLQGILRRLWYLCTNTSFWGTMWHSASALRPAPNERKRETSQKLTVPLKALTQPHSIFKALWYYFKPSWLPPKNPGSLWRVLRVFKGPLFPQASPRNLGTWAKPLSPGRPCNLPFCTAPCTHQSSVSMANGQGWHDTEKSVWCNG